MARQRIKERPAQGKRLVEVRKAAGLSQYELTEMLDVLQSNVAFWEQSEKPGRLGAGDAVRAEQAVASLFISNDLCPNLQNHFPKSLSHEYAFARWSQLT
jgi:transcriptional regulator with XRE-family HTH domain